jgi:hypothetical protein
MGWIPLFIVLGGKLPSGVSEDWTSLVEHWINPINLCESRCLRLVWPTGQIRWGTGHIQ